MILCEPVITRSKLYGLVYPWERERLYYSPFEDLCKSIVEIKGFIVLEAQKDVQRKNKPASSIFNTQGS